LLSKFIGKVELISRSLRFGVRNLRKLKDGTLLIVADGKIYRVTSDEDQKITYVFERGRGPLLDGWCEDSKNNIYVGEYFLNNARKMPVKLIRSRNCGRTWEVVKVFKKIRHIHCVQYDPFERGIWIGTGDRDKESMILFSEDEGESWLILGSGSQKFRTMSLIFTDNYIYWGTDTPTMQSYIYRFSRRDGRIERLAPVNGPIYYSATLKSGVKLFSTGAEGNSEGKSASWDSKAHIWASLTGKEWKDIISWEKDFWPYILGNGRILFARGLNTDILAFTTQCLRGVHNFSFLGSVIIES
jgi:hypothetical protein